MTIDKRAGFDWKCEARNCKVVLTHGSDRTPPEGFIAVQVYRGETIRQRMVGHACSAACTGALAEQLYVDLDKAEPEPAETIQEMVDAVGT